MVLLKLLLIFCSLGGFLLSLYIFHKKHRHEKMLCPIGGKCEAVLASQYNRFFGIPLETIGLFYYGAVFIFSTVRAVMGGDPFPLISFAVFGLTITAFLFSLYLTFIQAFTLKQWCTLCLTSAALCTIIFTSTFMTSQQSFVALLGAYQPLVSAFYLLALAVGLGCATVTDVFFLKFLRDYHISQSEYDVLSTLAQMMWASLAAIIVAGVGLALGAPDGYQLPHSMFVSWIVLLVILINAAVLNLIVAPKLLHISFREKHDHETGELGIIHKLAFELGAVSVVSWYFAFFLTVIPDTGYSFFALSIWYGVLVVVGVAVGRLFEYRIRQSSRTAV
ncbi:vitamin K epoxide reductase family protein [Candidatus Uhrbacteria bacterium]|nr:vitamin K epoxide reductase family protein [Candidatus Uhrbacteria bacterium]